MINRGNVLNKNEKNVILLNNLFNGEYIKEKVGGEIINIYKSDNDGYYVYEATGNPSYDIITKTKHPGVMLTRLDEKFAHLFYQPHFLLSLSILG